MAQFESLAGLKSSRALGVRGDYGFAVTVDSSVVLIGPNDRRVWASIVNTGNTEFDVCLGGVVGVGVQNIKLYPRGSLVIDRNMPWIGAVLVSHAVGIGDGSVDWTEVEVQP